MAVPQMRWTPEAKASVYLRWRAGETDRTIAEALGYTTHQVRKLRERQDWRTDRVTSKVDASRLVTMHAHGMTDADMARELAQTENAVRWVRKKLGLTSNGKGAKPVVPVSPARAAWDALAQTRPWTDDPAAVRDTGSRGLPWRPVAGWAHSNLMRAA